MSPSRWAHGTRAAGLLCSLSFICIACTNVLDAGSTLTDSPDSSTRVEEDGLALDLAGPLLLNNDGVFDNWQAEHALLAAAEGREIVGLVINRSPPWPDLDANVADWQRFLDAARSSGIDALPDPLASSGAPLIRPDSGSVPDTVPNDSEGARLIVQAANAVAPGGSPLVVVTGGRLTDVADAYLLDRSIAERMVVVSSLGRVSEEGARMTVPNGEMDPWADVIVAQHLTYVQVSAYYDQLADVPGTRLGELPDNDLGAWMVQKQPRIFDDVLACDHIALLAVLLPDFIREVSPVAIDVSSTEGEPHLLFDDQGTDWLVSDVDSAAGAAQLWESLARVF